MTSIKPSIKRLPVKWHNNAVVQMAYSAKKNQKFTRKTITQTIKKVQQDLIKQKFNGQIQVSLNYPGIGFRSNEWFKPNEAISLYSNQGYDQNQVGVEEEDPDKYSAFIIYLEKN
jgi:hypothetical protein